MKSLSGEFLSKILWALSQANREELKKEDILVLFAKAFEVENLYVDLKQDAKSKSDSNFCRMLGFEPDDLAKLNVMLPWSSYNIIANDWVFGSAWSGRKRNSAVTYPEALVANLNSRVPLAGLSVLELGCFEGHHSISLAGFAREVWAIDGRIENVIKTLVRVWSAGLENKISVNLLNLEKGELKEQLRRIGREDGFDLLHHRGVLYHLSNPVQHIIQCSEICKRHFYLHTQIVEEDRANAEVEVGGRKYKVAKFPEKAAAISPFAGMLTFALWMTESSLIALLKDLGFDDVAIFAKEQERNGLRIEMLASR